MDAEEIDLYRWLVDHIDNFPTELTLVVPKLIEGKVEAKPFIDGSTRLQVFALQFYSTNEHFVFIIRYI